MPIATSLMHTEGVVRRTSINLDFNLVDQAKAVLGTTETTETVHRALREVVRHDLVRQLAARRFELSDEEERELEAWTLGGRLREADDGAR